MNTNPTPDDGGPAFPSIAINPRYNGMSLRDYFAAHASDEDVKRIRESTAESVHPGSLLMIPVISHCQARYKFADAMLAARKEQS